jgi:hypothetical protein
MNSAAFNRLVELVARPYVENIRRELEGLIDCDPDLAGPGDGVVTAGASPAIPTDPETLLTRTQLAAALSDAGYPVSLETLATKATRGGSPPYRLFGKKPLYRWGDALEWARSKLGPVQRSTSEGDASKARTARSTAASAEATT